MKMENGKWKMQCKHKYYSRRYNFNKKFIIIINLSNDTAV